MVIKVPRWNYTLLEWGWGVAGVCHALPSSTTDVCQKLSVLHIRNNNIVKEIGQYP